MANEQTAWGTPVVCWEGFTNKLQIIKYGDVNLKLATGFKDINEVSVWVKERGGALGAKKSNFFLGQYREIYLPEEQTNV